MKKQAMATWRGSSCMQQGAPRSNFRNHELVWILDRAWRLMLTDPYLMVPSSKYVFMILNLPSLIYFWDILGSWRHLTNAPKWTFEVLHFSIFVYIPLLSFIHFYLSLSSLYLHLYLCLSIHRFIHLPIPLSIYPSIDLSIYLLICLSAWLAGCLPVCLSVWLSVSLWSLCLSVFLSVYLSISLSTSLSINLSVHLSINLIYQSSNLPIYQPTYLYTYLAPYLPT